ncbi:hypothetical protein JCM15519_24770 [Fundidesulfovibrio butyratiphilus]
MGTLRVFLALTVCINHFLPVFHMPSNVGPGARLAVEIFFMISGFYMALILSGKYAGPGRVRLFLTNRILRLYPTYLLLLGCIVAFFSVTSLIHKREMFAAPILHWFGMAPVWVRCWAVVANLFLFGQDGLFMISLAPEGGVCLNCPGSMPGFLGLAIPQAWSVEVEFLCYLFAPFLVRWRSRNLVLLVLPLLALKMGLDLQPGMDEFWPFRFPTSGFSLFLLGVLSFRVYQRFKDTGLLSGLAAKALCAAFWAYLFVYPVVPGAQGKSFAVYPFAFLAIPTLFHLTRHNAFDREFGELSYPVYLTHHFLFIISQYYVSSTWVVIPWTLVATLAASYAIHRFFQGPIERYRQARVRSA